MAWYPSRHSPAFKYLNCTMLLALLGCAATASSGGADPAAAGPAANPADIPAGLHAYTQAKSKNARAPDRLGGALTVEVNQSNGKARFNLPGTRKLDPAVFGTPDQPAGAEPASFPMLGIPLGNNEQGHPWRLQHGGEYTIVNHFSPFSDWYEASTGSVKMTVSDVQAIDSSSTRDKVDFTANFELPDGAAYRVVVKKPISHGKAFPMFGGVVTNHLIHGAANIAPKLLPTTFAYVAFWGMGDIYKDGSLINPNQLVHVWVSERIRGEGDRLRMDHEAGGPSQGKTLHMIVAPYKVVPGQGPVPTPLGTMFMPFPYVKPNIAREKQMAEASGDQHAKETVAQIQEVAMHTKQHVVEATSKGEMFGMPFIMMKFDDIRISTR